MAGSVYRGGTHVWCHLSTLLADPRPVPVQTHCVSDDINGHRRARMETAHRTVSVGATVQLCHVWAGQGWTRKRYVTHPPMTYMSSRSVWSAKMLPH